MLQADWCDHTCVVTNTDALVSAESHIDIALSLLNVLPCTQEVVGSSPTGGAEFSSFFPFYLLSFLYLFLSFFYHFLCTSLRSALSGVESGASFAITEGPAH